jgi:hypothetical protein
MSDVTNASVNDLPSEAATQSPGLFRRIHPIALAALVLLGILGTAGFLLLDGTADNIPAAAEQKTPALTVTTATPRSEVWPVTLTASGSIAAWQEASVGTQVGGYQLVDVQANVGDRVRRGQVLARLDSALLRAEEAQLLANDEQATADRQRALALQSEGAISDQEVLQSVTAAKVSAALLASKRLQLRYTDVVGLVMLMGIVTKNSILLVEYAVVGMSGRGLSRRDALIDACHKRARPIMMTTVAMIAGMLPIALGLGADASFRQPMAIAVIGGLISSTALSLLVVPVVFTWLDRLHRSLATRRTEHAHS